MNKPYYQSYPPGTGELPCHECGFVFTVSQSEEFKTHMVTEHNYIRLGHSVFKRHGCAYGNCKSPALYRYGTLTACKEHYLPLKNISVLSVRQRDQHFGKIAKNFEDLEGGLKSIDAKRNCDKYNKRKRK